MTQSKICTGTCGLELPATTEYFHKHSRGKFGLHPWCKICYAEHYRQYNLNRKLLVLSHYGSRCAVCGITDPAFLTIDHIDGGGNNHRIIVGHKIRGWLIRNDFPSDFQVLCWNHNWSKYLDSISVDNKNSRYQRKLKRVVVDQYGGKCACCGETNIGFLTIDHTNGGGRQQRRDFGLDSSHKFYRWLRDNNFPGGFRVLCFNHNCGGNHEEKEQSRKTA